MQRDQLNLSEEQQNQWPCLERLAVSAGLIQSALSHVYPAAGETLLRCPYLMVLPSKEIIPMALPPSASAASSSELMPEVISHLDQERANLESSPHRHQATTNKTGKTLSKEESLKSSAEEAKKNGAQNLFELWPNKFGKLTFGFARDHLEMAAPDLLEALASAARESQDQHIILGPFAFKIKPGVGFEKGAEPSRVSAPAHLALCKKMASTPGWIVSALERMEKGESALNVTLSTLLQKPITEALHSAKSASSLENEVPHANHFTPSTPSILPKQEINRSVFTNRSDDSNAESPEAENKEARVPQVAPRKKCRT